MDSISENKAINDNNDLDNKDSLQPNINIGNDELGIDAQPEGENIDGISQRKETVTSIARKSKNSVTNDLGIDKEMKVKNRTKAKSKTRKTENSKERKKGNAKTKIQGTAMKSEIGEKEKLNNEMTADNNEKQSIRGSFLNENSDDQNKSNRGSFFNENSDDRKKSTKGSVFIENSDSPKKSMNESFVDPSSAKNPKKSKKGSVNPKKSKKVSVINPNSADNEQSSKKDAMENLDDKNSKNELIENENLSDNINQVEMTDHFAKEEFDLNEIVANDVTRQPSFTDDGLQVNSKVKNSDIIKKNDKKKSPKGKNKKKIEIKKPKKLKKDSEGKRKNKSEKSEIEDDISKDKLMSPSKEKNLDKNSNDEKKLLVVENDIDEHSEEILGSINNDNLLDQEIKRETISNLKQSIGDISKKSTVKGKKSSKKNQDSELSKKKKSKVDKSGKTKKPKSKIIYKVDESAIIDNQKKDSPEHDFNLPSRLINDPLKIDDVILDGNLLNLPDHGYDRSINSEDSGDRTPATGHSSRRKKKTAGSERGKAKSKKKKVKILEDIEQVETVMPEIKKNNELTILPEDCFPIYLTTESQKNLKCVIGTNVTENLPYIQIKKTDILANIKQFGDLSDFAYFSSDINNYKDETGEILLCYDKQYKFGKNFYIILNSLVKQFLLNPDEEGDISLKFARKWKNRGSDLEIEEGFFKYNRDLLHLIATKPRNKFGGPINLEDRVKANNEPFNDYVACLQTDERPQELLRLETEKSVQAIPILIDNTAQTIKPFPKNASIQYQTREFTINEQNRIWNSEEMLSTVNSFVSKSLFAVQQNEICNLFYDDWYHLDVENFDMGTKSNTNFKEYQSFNDLHYSKNKTVSWVEWHPVYRNIVAVSLSERGNYDEQLNGPSKLLSISSFILLWSFHDPIHPQLVLQSPEDVNIFKFNPKDADIIAGGCVNGQLILWDITNHSHLLKVERNQKKKLYGSNPFEKEGQSEVPMIRWIAVSMIQSPHHSSIMDLQWIPDHFEVNRYGSALENLDGKCYQIMTAATDHLILFWETKVAKTILHQQIEAKWEEEANPMNLPFTYRHLDLNWRPMMRITFNKLSGKGEYCPTKFSIFEQQGKYKIIEELNKESKEKNSGTKGQFRTYHKRSLPNMNTNVYVGTEDGELVYINWVPEKDGDTGKFLPQKPLHEYSLHAGPIVALVRNMFCPDVILCIGGWSFTIWKEDVFSGPIVNMAFGKIRLTCGNWSPSRPSVFFIGRDDGSINVWDLLDKTHEPSLSQNISNYSITNVNPFYQSSKQQLLSVTDNFGTLHVLEIPNSLSNQADKEVKTFQNYINREVSRRAFCEDRLEIREEEKKQKAKLKVLQNLPERQNTDDDELANSIELQEYTAYLQDEFNFRLKMGLVAEAGDFALPGNHRQSDIFAE